MIMMINKWVFPVFAMISMATFYIQDNTSISPVGSILIVLLVLIGIAVTERFDYLFGKDKNDA